MPFLPIETVLCLASMLVVDHRRYGGSTNHLAPAPVPQLAALFQRTPASVLAKQANLDGSRANGARHEVEAAERILGDPAVLSNLYATILTAAREVDVGIDRLPDFLEQEGDDMDLLGQDELDGEDLEAAVAGNLARLTSSLGVDADPVTERLLVATLRIGQHRFAADVLRTFGHSCGFCGMRPGLGLERRGLLVASHIKPWRASSVSVRDFPYRGALAFTRFPTPAPHRSLPLEQDEGPSDGDRSDRPGQARRPAASG